MTYTPLALDTPVESELAHLALLRSAGIVRRSSMASSCTRSVQRMTLIGLKRRESSLEAISTKLARALLGFSPDFSLFGTPETWAMSDPISMVYELHPFFENLGIPYYVTGGVAASCHGEPRSTLDLDLVIEIEQSDIDLLGTALTEAGFYVPETNLENVINGSEATLCVTHQTQCVKVDITISKGLAFDRSKMQRRELVDDAFYVCSPEDTILQKLRWGSASRSEKQWRDVQGILRIQGDSLNLEYLKDWAKQLRLSEQLSKAFEDSSLEGDRV